MTAETAAPTLRPALTQSAILGEGLQWHAPSGRWWWTDIEGGCIHAWTPGAAATLVLRLPERVGCFVHARSGALLLGMAKRLARLALPDLQACGEFEAAPQELVPVEAGLPTTRVNDGRCDRSGNLVFGTLDEARPRQTIGGFYQYSQAHGLRRLALDGVAIANSICFSLDGRRMHYCDTLSRRIMVCDYDADTAGVSEPRLFAKKEIDDCWPDGSTIDARGCLWNAEWGNAAVARYAPDGRLLGRYAVPVRNVSCPALGGPAGGQLLVTTARQELSSAELMAMPLSGSLFGIAVEPGLYLPEPLFNDA
ncbi:SMP-30/gluconolactonase/LRE family protein [Pelomonas aquatica]|jgi:L-arabinonolactonase|uniref:SMP-30/gluconolactonase/LRE family protein n=1 Tax=Pelomonas aquatica TaxID=431058 RepID=A0A9X4LF74_9BURK|nr:SMP-30/gluconolactonase/LRE family protein [Pelomonas aquatica]MCY4753053.1 SMP-30/gluconolactonase/LRE family protein [Pelomonas aquatica]MDG0862008.1 SMP-30/gluconolactonase/LRE family protein [Pelomonas aquatica]